MSKEYLQKLSPKRQQAVAELTGMIRQHYPDTTFMIGPGEDDRQGTYITATVDVDDPDAVTDLTIDRELELQIDQRVPVYVIPIRTPERTAVVRSQQTKRGNMPPSLPRLRGQSLLYASGHGDGDSVVEG